MPVAADLERVPLALTLAFWLVVAESAAESAYVVARDGYGSVGKGLLLMAFVAKVAFAHLARRRSAGGVLGLLVFELVGILAALGATWAIEARIALVACVVVVFALVLSSLDTFPTPDLPTR